MSIMLLGSIKESKLLLVDSYIKIILKNKDRYLKVQENLNIPWYTVAVIHNMESSLNFNSHLHNGDPLTAKTVHVPKGRPLNGKPPFTWEQSVCDALMLRNVQNYKDWSLEGVLFFIEGFNGWGYRKYHQKVLSPYLWSWSGHYIKGKYASDGKWDSELVSKQCGAATLLKVMDDQKILRLCSSNIIPKNEEPLTELKAPEIYTPDIFENKICLDKTL
jgi:lysozyme family protein